ncbi:MAG TPA: DUF1214 domain-containing protein [Acidimicrobiia bacterium]|nr:DUF1214 domain-containing protein [Acidimicrobiia bacterium]
MPDFVSPAWMPSSLREAAVAGDATPDDLASGAAWSHLLTKLQAASATVLANPASRNPVDMAAGLRHLLVLLWIGIDDALRRDSGAVLAVRPSNTDAVFKWGMDCPDCLYTGAGLRGGETYRLWGNRGTARYVGLQTMAGMASTANVLLDEIELEPNGDFEIILSADAHDGNWMQIADDATQLVVRHFFYDWDTEVASSLSIERLSGPRPAPRRSEPIDPRAAMARQIVALGDFVEANLDFFLQFATPERPNTFNPPFDGTAMGAAAENRPVIGSFLLGPDEALVVEVEPPEGLYWSYSIGNPWWETIDYARHQSSLNGHQAEIDADGMLRVVIAHEDPGIANWLDTAGHGEGPVILRCVRTETAPVPTTRAVPFAEVANALPAGARRISPAERATVMDARARGVARRFVR